MRAKNWKSFSKIEEKRGLKENIADTISLWCAIGLLWYAAVSIIGEKFPEFIQTMRLAEVDEVAILGTNLVEIKMEWGLIVVFLLLLWVGGDWPKKYFKYGSLIVSGVALFFLGYFIYTNWNQLFAGATAIAKEYIRYWNVYYGSSIFIGSGDKTYAPMAFSALLMLMWVLVWGIAYASKKRVLLALFPVIMLGLELVIGLSPTGNGLFCILFGCLLLINAGGKVIFRKAVVLIGVAATLFVCNLVFGEDISELTTEEKKQAVLDWQEDFTITDLVKGFSIDFHFSKEGLGNDAPNYTGKVMLEMETSQKPKNSIYLKGFHGTDYKNGTWEYDDSVFNKVRQTYADSEQILAKTLFSMPYDSISKCLEGDISFISGEEKESRIQTSYELHYVGTTGDVAYAPYYTVYDSLDEEYELKGDFLLKKSVGDKTISGLAIFQGVDKAVLKEAGVNAPETKISRILNELALEYAKTEESLAFIDEVKAYVDEYMQYDDETTEGTAATNSLRLGYAQTIKNYLSTQMSYSVQLDTLPAGADPVEYAVMEGHEGYCMHFASAGALLLKKFGVPARYVSGYVVFPSSFVEKEGGYYAQITDYAAHTWVEIYLDNIGWVPFEMTPGYNSSNTDSLPTEGDLDYYEELSEERRGYFEDSEVESESESEDVQQTENSGAEDEDKPDDSESEEELDGESNSQDKNDSDDKDNLDDNNQGLLGGDTQQIGETIVGVFTGIFKWGLGIALLVVFVVGGVSLFRKGLFRCEKVIDSEVKRKLTRKAVKRINRRIYRMLRIKLAMYSEKNFKRGYWTDAKMEAELIAAFDFVSEEEWRRYMEIVKKMHYSHEEISVEEMDHCYACYKKVWASTFWKQFSDKVKKRYKKGEEK